MQPPKSGFIAIVGRPNTGKSTLLNGILKQDLSIVTPKAQTTREAIRGIFTQPQGQIVFTDTPGLHRARSGGINEYMVREAIRALEGTELVWYLVDPASELHHEKPVIQALAKVKEPIFVIFNKMDLAGKKFKSEKIDLLQREIGQEISKHGMKIAQVFHISAIQPQSWQVLMQKTWELMPQGGPFFPDPEQMSDRPVRFFVAEKIREQLFMKLGEELPYSCAVKIDRFDERVKPLRIEAEIFVERESQKPMVIGQGGKKIKEIGMAARWSIEAWLGERVHLSLQVAVLKDWSSHGRELKKLGYFIE